MSRGKLLRFAGVLCASFALMMVLAGCMQSKSENASEEQLANRQYMTQVNQIMDDLSARLEGFTDAVSRADVVSMKTQADNAVKAIDHLNDLETPDGMKDIQANYVEGCNRIKDALTAYVDLYTEIDSATEEQPFDYTTYDTRIKEIQDIYDVGIEKLQAGDTAATNKE